MIKKSKKWMISTKEVIGLIPAGGRGTRLGRLSCSKEIYPIGFDLSRGGRPKTVCHFLLEKMRFAGIQKAYIVLREGKWDIPGYLRDGKIMGMHLAYLIMDVPFGVPFTIDQAFPFVGNAIIAFGFPDIFFESDNAFVKILNRLSTHHCDVVLGLFPSDRPEKTDMVDIDAEGRVKNIVVKPRQTEMDLTWGIAVWASTFTRFMHSKVKACKPSVASKKELFIGDVIREAVCEGLCVEAVQVSDKSFLDIGTPDDLRRATKRLMVENNNKIGDGIYV